jgi:hypothetical protein
MDKVTMDLVFSGHLDFPLQIITLPMLQPLLSTVASSVGPSETAVPMDSIARSLREKKDVPAFTSSSLLITCNVVNYENLNDISGSHSTEDYDYSLQWHEVMKFGP